MMEVMVRYAEFRKQIREGLSAVLGEREAHAETLRFLEDGLGKSSAWLLAHGDDVVPDPEVAQMHAWLLRREKGEPLAYILGWTLWRDRRFAVGPEVLIPRSETELLLETAFVFANRLKVKRVVDVGTGSGILAVTLALESELQVSAIDICPGALSVAKRNAAALGASIDFHEGYLLDGFPNPLELVVSNPPYIDPADGPSLQRELTFEPDLALYAPEKGLALSTELLYSAHRRGAKACLLEIGSGQGTLLMERAMEGGWENVEVEKDWGGHDRVLKAWITP